MINLGLYSNKSATNVVNKELSYYGTASGVFRNDSSIIDPIITLETGGDTFLLSEFNYFYLPVFKRYYYLTNLLSINGATEQGGFLWELHGHVDVLMSFADCIKNQFAIVSRQEKNYNLMLDDGFFMTYQNPKIQTKLFSVPDPFEKQEFVLIVAGS